MTENGQDQLPTSVWWDQQRGLMRRDAHVCPVCGWGGMNLDETDAGLRCGHCGETFSRFHDDQRIDG